VDAEGLSGYFAQVYAEGKKRVRKGAEVRRGNKGLKELHRRMKRKKRWFKRRLRGMQRELIGLEERHK